MIIVAFGLHIAIPYNTNIVELVATTNLAEPT